MAGDLLDGLKTQVGDRYAKLASNPVAIVGTDASGNIVPLGASGSVGSTKVVGIQEVDTFATGLTAANVTVQAGALSIGFNPSSDFTGTIQGAAWTGAKGAITRTAQPGNTCPAFVVTRSAGSYDLYVVTPA